jgi:hypothetical protein
MAAMKKVSGFLLVLALAATAARAHIGDTLAQLRDMYGATAKHVGSTLIFQRNGYSISVLFDGDHSAMEIFTRDGSLKGKNDITDGDIQGILSMEGEGMAWSQVESRSGEPTWVRADTRLIARLTPGQKPDEKVLVVMLNEK